ncbi:MAG: GspH/FimT family pseudopilin [Nitrospirota bacterium]
MGRLLCSRRRDGFTLVELILIILILVTIAAAVIPTIGDTTGMRMSATARKVQSDIAYAQSLAMTSGQRYRVYFNLAPAPAAGYAVVNNADGDANWGEAGEFARDPNGGDSLSVTLNAGTYAGVTISAVGFSGSFVEFDSLGRPYDNLGLLAAANTVTLAGGSATQTVTVTPQTGRVTVP